jgi:hypothetical protein
MTMKIRLIRMKRMMSKHRYSKPYTEFMKFSPFVVGSLACRLVVLSCSFATFSMNAPAQLFGGQQRGPVQRVVQGKVTDKNEVAIKGAVVYLKDGHSLAVKSFISGEDGGYRFGQLAQSTDYELWAEHDGKKSSVKTISSFDTKNQFVINLKIEK